MKGENMDTKAMTKAEAKAYREARKKLLNEQAEWAKKTKRYKNLTNGQG